MKPNYTPEEIREAIKTVDDEICLCEDGRHTCRISKEGIIPTNEYNWADKLRERLDL